MGVDIVISSAFMGLCIAVVFYDLRHMRIPDAISVGFVCLFAVSVVFLVPIASVLASVLTAMVVFVVCFILFALRVMGGGDTKVIPAMVVFVPLQALPSVLLFFALSLLGSILAVLMARLLVKNPTQRWAVLTSQKLPMGLAIGVTGLVAEVIRVS